MGFFSKKKNVKEESAKNFEDNAEKVSPFMAGRNEWNERYGTLAKTAANWRRISFVLVVLCFACVGWVITTASNVKSVPFIVEVDKHGYEIAVKPVSPSGIDDRLIISRLGRFITSLKTVLNDDSAQATYMSFVYNSTPQGTAAYKKMVDFFQQNNPLKIAANEKSVIFVKLKSILPLGNLGKTWRGEWEEQKLSGGSVVSTKNYTGLFEIAVTPPTKMEEILDNPLGLFVTDFNITEELQKK